MYLNNEQIKEIRGLQKALDIRVRENNEIALDKDLTLEKFIALKTEFYEFVNEIESMKYWKKNKGKDHILEEACDTLHFIFSIAIDKGVEIEFTSEKYEALDEINKIDTNELILMIDAILLDCHMDDDWELLNDVLALMTVVLKRSGFSSNNLYSAYISKNKVNHERQDNNY